MSESVDQLAEKVRTVLPRMSGRPHTPVAHLAASIEEVQEARTALDALLVRLAEAEKERDAKSWIRMRNAANTGDETLYRITADDRIEFGEALEEVRVRFEAAEAERDRLKAALEQIGGAKTLADGDFGHELRARQDIARAALAADEEGGE